MSIELVHATRGNLVESIYRGDIAVVNAEGDLLYKAGDPDKLTFIRSSAKPIQALPVLESGAVDHFGIEESEYAIFCASHNGELEHTQTVQSILTKIGLDESYLQCGFHPPVYRPAADELVRKGIKPFEIHSNCSGKHSGMLTLTKHKGWPLENYTDLEHPVQQSMLSAMAKCAHIDESEIEIGIDGCGVPVHGLTVFQMARAWANFTNPVHLEKSMANAAKRVAKAMFKYPSKVAGTDRFCTALLEAGKGAWVNKSGAQGVYCFGLIDKNIGIALKIEDGNGKAASSAMVEVLDQLGLLNDKQKVDLDKFQNPKLKNHRKDIIGELKPVFNLEKVL
jgi:L-asparaginase II